MPELLWVVGADERSILSPSAPSSREIDDAFAHTNASALNAIGREVWETQLASSGPYPGTEADWGSWAAPRPRIVRRLATLELSGSVTSAASVWRIPQTSFAARMTPERIIAVVATVLKNNLDNSGTGVSSPNWGEVTVFPFRESSSGSIGSWENGSMSITRTRDAFPELFGRLDSNENPIGPESAATHPTTMGEAVAALGSNLRGAADVTWTWLKIAIVGGAAYLGYQYFSGNREFKGGKLLPKQKTKFSDWKIIDKSKNKNLLAIEKPRDSLKVGKTGSKVVPVAADSTWKRGIR